MTYPNCWSTSTMIDISDYSLFLRETVSSKKEDKETSLQAHPINDAKRTLIRIADWYDETLSVEHNFLYAQRNDIKVKKHSLYNYCYRLNKGHKSVSK